MAKTERTVVSVDEGPIYVIDSTPDKGLACRILAVHLRNARTLRANTKVKVLDDAMNTFQIERERVFRTALEKLGGSTETSDSPSDWISVVHVDATPDVDLPRRVLSAYVDRFSSGWSGQSDDGSAECRAKQMNVENDKRREVLNEALRLLR